MIAEYALRAALEGDSAIVALVGTRIYPSDDVPQNVSGAHVTYQRISSISDLALDGNEEPWRIRVQLNILAATRASVRAVATAIKTAVRAAGVAGVQLFKIDGDGDFPQEAESKLFAAHVDVIVTLSAAEAA